jgi:fatty acid desaturase
VHRSRRHHRDEPVVQSVTTAPASIAEEQASRIKRYLFTMGIRTVCFIGAVLTATAGAPWWLWGTLALLAVVLPYVAVVMVNAVAPRGTGRGSAPVTPRGDSPHQLGR